jgi:hypothetical protein
MSFGIAYASSGDELDIDEIEVVRNYPYVDQLLLESSRYTQVEETNPDVLANYHSNYYLVYTEQELQALGFNLMFDTDEIAVYFELNSFSIIIKNKITGYFWSSRPEFQNPYAPTDNSFTRNFFNSGLWFDYASIKDPSVPPSRITGSIYSIAEVRYIEFYEGDMDYTPLIQPFIIRPTSYNKRRIELTMNEVSDTHFSVHVDVLIYGFSLDVEVHLVDNAIEVHIPSDSIEETGTDWALLGVHVFPYFGAPRGTNYPGYVVIPDGVGALVRTNVIQNQVLQANFYGGDMGYNNQAISSLSIPLFGIVHEANANGFFAYIVEGAESATLIGDFARRTRSHSIRARFNYREIYKNVIDRAGNGSNTVSANINPIDFKIQYRLLSNEKANYVGMANEYKEYLIDQGLLELGNEKVVGDNIPIQLSYIMQDQEPAFVGTSRVQMTSPDQAKRMYDFFVNQGLTNQQMTLLGWSKDGFVMRAPYRTAVHNESDYKSLIKHVKEDGNTIYLDNQYVMSSELSSQVVYNRDVARNISKLKMVRNSRSLNGQITEMYFLYPDRSYSLAKSDLSYLNELGVSGASLTDIGNTLFSYYDGRIYTRSNSIEQYQKVGDLYDSLLLSNPNQYMFEFTDGYLDMPITNAQFSYYTDLIPLLPILLKGAISYYTPFLNFNALGIDRLLTMVDFGINPSYVLTHEATYNMRYTLANRFYTTSFTDFNEEIVETYHFLNNALSSVLNETIVSRVMLKAGLSEVTYSNGVRIYVNYTHNLQSAQIGDTLYAIGARDYRVVMP